LYAGDAGIYTNKLLGWFDQQNESEIAAEIAELKAKQRVGQVIGCEI